MKPASLATAILLAIVHLMPASLRAQEPTLEGVWLHDNKRIQVKIAPCDDRREEPLCGKIVWLKNPDDKEGEKRLDTKNPDQVRREQPIIGTTVIRGLVRSGPRLWTNGTIYNPDDGETYSARITMVDPGTLHVRVFVMLPLLGKTKVWARVEN